jgi:phage baseplate assembly protein W
MSFDLQLLNGDLSLKTDGTMRIVTDTPKLRQDILKLLTTSLGANTFNPWYGCPIGDTMIGQNYPDNLLSSSIQTAITQGLENLQTLQMSQATDQSVSLAETIAEIAKIEVERNLADPRQLNIRVTVLTRALTLIAETFTLMG